MKKYILKFAPVYVLSLPRPAKRLIALIVDICLSIFTVWLSFYLRTGEFISVTGTNYWLIKPLIYASLTSVIIAVPVFILFGLYRAIFRYSGLTAMLGVSRAILVYSIIFCSIITVVGITGVPRTIGFIQPLILFFAIGGSRAVARFWLGGIYQSQIQQQALPRALVYGAGKVGRQLVTALDHGYEIRVIGFLDDDDRLHGQVLNGKPIHSPDDISDLITTKGVTHILLAIPSAGRHNRNTIIEKVSKHQLVVRTLPSLTDLAQGKVTISQLRELDIHDLLAREPVAPNHIMLSKKIESKIVVVTGAGGSIGSELCRQIIKQKPKKLLLIEINEYLLYTIYEDLKKLCDTILNLEKNILVPLLASVHDESRIDEIFESWRPDIVYHAAAYKHVPLVEYNLAEGVKNNVLGTLIMAQAAIKNNVKDFILISTDKAVRPTNAMGSSKRLAEIILQSLNETISNPSKIKFSMVRFGNVLDSSGSVIPLFRKQVRDGGPITLTHPEITRYFMTIPEAAQLVIQSGAMAKGGEVYVLDMGEPVKILDLAIKIIELSGLKLKDKKNTEGDIEIKITGLRPGEKLYEELLLGNNPLDTNHPKIKMAREDFIQWDKLEPDLEIIKVLINNNDIKTIISLLQKIVPGYKPNKDVVDFIFNEQIQKKDYHEMDIDNI